MRKFNVNVNGKSYAVEVEEVGGVAAAPAAAPVAAPVAAAPVAPAPAAAAPAAAPAPAPAAPAAAGKGDPVNSPMPGLVKKLCFANGATVEKGVEVITLEAMKMDTPVVAPKAGVITYCINEGANVDTGALLCTIA